MHLLDPNEVYSERQFRCTECNTIKKSMVKGYPCKYRDIGLCNKCSGYPWGITKGFELIFSPKTLLFWLARKLLKKKKEK